jgi:hypothetical protein
LAGRHESQSITSPVYNQPEGNVSSLGAQLLYNMHTEVSLSDMGDGVLEVREQKYMVQAPEALEITQGGGAPDIGAGTTVQALFSKHILEHRSECTTTQLEVPTDTQAAPGTDPGVMQATACATLDRSGGNKRQRRLLKVRSSGTKV